MEKQQVSFDLAVGNSSKSRSSNSDVLDRMKSRYPCIYQPMNPSNATVLEEQDDVDTDEDVRYLTSLWVFGSRDIDDGPESPQPPSLSHMMVEQNIIDHHIIKDRIASALTDIRFRENGVLVQFWSPVEVRKRWLLTTWNQPFGIGVADGGLYSYRLKSELRAIVVDGEDREELGPPGRVYSRKLPEWSLDVHAGNNMYGYIDLPVFESSGDSCVGVLEIITSSNYVDYAFEVQEVLKALKKQNLRSPNIFEDSSICVADERRRHEHDEIFKVLTAVCDIHNLPLAQTWALSGHTSYVANFGNIEHCCSSFNRSCIGKVCMSTYHLPFYVRDLSFWEFHKACSEIHLDISHGVVGTSFSSCGTRFFRDVTELDEDDYPLVPFARMSGITSCVAIYITSYDDEYVLEFFLPTCNANEAELLKLTKTVREQLKNTSCLQLDIMMAPKPLFTEKEEENIENESSNSVSVGPSQSVFPYLEKGIADFDTNPTRKTRMKGKRSKSSICLEEIKKHFGKTLNEAATILNVSRSTLKRICRNHGIKVWPYRYLESPPSPITLSTEIGVIPPDSENQQQFVENEWNDTNKSDINIQLKRTEISVGLEELNEHSEENVMELEDMPLEVMSENSDNESSNSGSVGTSLGGIPQRKRKRSGRVISLEEIQKHTVKPIDEAAAIHNDSMSMVGHSFTNQQEQTNLPDGRAQPSTSIKEQCIENTATEEGKILTIKARYEENTVEFPFIPLDGLVKLEELIATKFQLSLGSFKIKYEDRDGEMILIACDRALIESVGDSKEPVDPTVITLFVFAHC
ncbi:NIN-like protein [Artemisia annua]|uniref:NIN-like protein n=1 Tax=Artemisia annua TaxID=35608 RepID=A0A2U1NW32_ARTAN|nr:NIN-like protein [Artemisia annua]